ncbi:uncharacterized protein LOC113295561 [Papaver somniferum]|uniref:uncharacterized protein LOC113295561 n=1 Tax=Papaver somniferum TaxID=3469 RepID=UPI000E705B72|nr:uncharacterized protein LOC113295561 [Papaver somniferum]
MDTTPSVKHFMWKAAHAILPTNMRMAAVLPYINTNCNLCNEGQETLTHLFLDCNFASQVWMHFNLDKQYVTNGATTFHEWLNGCFEHQDRDRYAVSWQVLCSIIIWYIWKARCNITFRKKNQNSANTTNSIANYINNYMIVNKKGYNIMHSLYYNQMDDENMKITKQQTTEQPTTMNLKMNVVLSMTDSAAKAGIGLTLCDYTGTIREARGLNADCTTWEELEMKGAEAAFQWAAKWSGHTISFRSNSEPFLLLLIGKYATTREQRYRISADFGNKTKFKINFIAVDFTLVRKFNVIWAAKLSVFCN